MIILDTSVRTEFFKKIQIFTTAKKVLEAKEVYGLECIFGELLQGAKNNRERDLIISYWRYLPRIDKKEIWIEAGKYSGENRLASKGIGLIDAVIIIAAFRSKSKIWTLDKKLKKFLNQDIIFI